MFAARKLPSFAGGGTDSLPFCYNVKLTTAGSVQMPDEKPAYAPMVFNIVPVQPPTSKVVTQADGVVDQAAGPPKMCVGCGVTKTPQWREGPAGPKTLCNACGVRRYREKNGEKGGSKAHKVQKYNHSTHSDDAATRSTHGDPLSDMQQASNRGKRKAAEKAMKRTHDFANRGEWDWEERSPAMKAKRQREYELDELRPKPLDVDKIGDIRGSTASYTSAHSITEEVEWTPSNRASPLYNGGSRPCTFRGSVAPSSAAVETPWNQHGASVEEVPTPPLEPAQPYPHCDHDCSAAVDLMCLSSARNHPFKVNYDKATELNAAKVKDLLERCGQLAESARVDTECRMDLQDRLRAYHTVAAEVAQGEREVNELAQALAARQNRLQRSQRDLRALQDCLAVTAKVFGAKR